MAVKGSKNSLANRGPASIVHYNGKPVIMVKLYSRGGSVYNKMTTSSVVGSKDVAATGGKDVLIKENGNLVSWASIKKIKS